MLNQDCLAADGLVNGVSSGTPDGFQAGQAYVGHTALCTTSTDSSDAWNGGFRRSKAGALVVVDATAGLPANSQPNAGIMCDPNGAACYIQAVSAGAGAVSVMGVAVNSDGRFYMNLV